jgi:hypothetical protein
VPRETVDQWVAEGRVSADCELSSESDGAWKAAADVYPVLRPVPAFELPRAALETPLSQSRERGQLPPDAGERFLKPHRGGLVLALGILSWAIGCPLFGIMAWVMGSSDLREMERGQMDSSGMSLTQAGQIIGMIHVILGVIVLVVLLLGSIMLGMLG